MSRFEPEVFAFGRPDEALPILETKSEDNWYYLGYLYAVTGRREEAEALAAKHPDAPAGQMLIYCGLGDKEPDTPQAPSFRR